MKPPLTGSRKYKQGVLRLKNPSKYAGDPTKVIYRSSWEKKFQQWLDSSKRVLRWGSEEIAIPYFNPVDKETHRYFPDFFVELLLDGQRKRYIIEIKPHSECLQPKRPRSITEGYLRKLNTYVVNQSKWVAASEFAGRNGMEFKVFTERDLFFQD
jgi:hypothetical protein